MAYKFPPTAMKKTTIVTLFVAVLGLSITSCSKDDDVPEPNVVLSTTNIVMYYEQTKKLTAENATSWRTENDFVATVDKDGLVTGGHVGTTKIIASNGSSSATCNVTIQPRYNLYDSPILDWGASMSTIRNKETHEYVPASSSSSSLVYNFSHDTDNPCLVMYAFEDGELYWITLFLKWNYFSYAVDYLLERYQPMSVDRVKQYAMFWDAFTKDKLKTAILIKLTEMSGSPIIQINYADTSKIPDPSSLKGKPLTAPLLLPFEAE